MREPAAGRLSPTCEGRAALYDALRGLPSRRLWGGLRSGAKFLAEPNQTPARQSNQRENVNVAILFGLAEDTRHTVQVREHSRQSVQDLSIMK